MANKLVIVESPTKVRTPERILDNSYKKVGMCHL